ncbi:hypothetical protein J5N97_011816 [Dioscorea zingiberensis]|uniref:Uncharacterized protein n=1 Tax=Dioscorea zingiberensis TaxID=325984 RepID=A0A9D5D1T6_9LILI|nr:hypothetical protein J5N97_011816 [Dioscorea zingiberensis]
MAAAGVVSAEIPKSADGGDDLLLSRSRTHDFSPVDGFMDGKNYPISRNAMATTCELHPPKRFLICEPLTLIPWSDEEPPIMVVDSENGRAYDSQSNGEKGTKLYNIGEREQWCLTTLGYVKAFSRKYEAVVPHNDVLDREGPPHNHSSSATS